MADLRHEIVMEMNLTSDDVGRIDVYLKAHTSKDNVLQFLELRAQFLAERHLVTGFSTNICPYIGKCKFQRWSTPSMEFAIRGLFSVPFLLHNFWQKDTWLLASPQTCLYIGKCKFQRWSTPSMEFAIRGLFLVKSS